MQSESTIQDTISTPLESMRISASDNTGDNTTHRALGTDAELADVSAPKSGEAASGVGDDKAAPVEPSYGAKAASDAVKDKDAVREPSSRPVRYAELRPNGTFPLDEKLNYDRLPDVKAYLMLLGTENRYRFVWYHKSGDTDGTDDADDEDAMERKRLTDEAVRRGVHVLNQSWKEGKGVFVDPNAPAMDGPIPWLRATGVIEKWFQSLGESMRPDTTKESEPNYVNRGLWHGNVRVPLDRPDHDWTFFSRLRDASNAELDEGAPWMSKIIPEAEKWARDQQKFSHNDTEDHFHFDPASVEFAFYIHRLYGRKHILEYVEQAWRMPCVLDDRNLRDLNRTRVGGTKFDESSWPFPGSFADYVIYWRDDDLDAHEVEYERDDMERGEYIFGHSITDFECSDASSDASPI